MIDLIDVPGHEDFIRTMISGATGIDGVVLVVAANEGVMPQTREHFDIAELLGVKRGLIVLTKTDLVSADELELAEEDVRDYLSGTFLEEAPDGAAPRRLRGDGMGDLREASGGHIPVRARPVSDGGFYLPVDQGVRYAGLRGGGYRHVARRNSCAADQAVEILPGGEPASIRGLQIHNRHVDAAFPGQRVAVNLRHRKQGALSRGDVLAAPGYLRPARRVDVELRVLQHVGEPLKNGATVRVLFGATEEIAKVRLLGTNALDPGEAGLVQLRFRRKVVAQQGERFIVRGLTPVLTIGGGSMLEVGAPRHRRFDSTVVTRLRSAAAGDTVALVRASLEEAGLESVDREALRQKLGLTEADMEAAVGSVGAIEVEGGRLMDASALGRLLDGIRAAVEQFHRQYPRRQGLAMASIPTLLKVDIDEAALRHAVNELQLRGELRNDASILSRTGFDPLASLSVDERRVAKEIDELFRTCGLMPPPVESVLRGDRVRTGVLRLLTDTGALVRLKTYDRSRHLVMHRDVLRDVRRRLRDRFPYPAEFTVADVRDELGTTRKYIVPLMEHLDATGVTIRTGNIRRLRDR